MIWRSARSTTRPIADRSAHLCRVPGLLLQVTLKQWLRSRAPGLTPRSVLDKISGDPNGRRYLPTTDAAPSSVALHRTRAGSGTAASNAEAQFARPTAARIMSDGHSDIAMTAALWCRPYRTQPREPPAWRMIRCECERRAKLMKGPDAFVAIVHAWRAGAFFMAWLTILIEYSVACRAARWLSSCAEYCRWRRGASVATFSVHLRLVSHPSS